MSDVLMFHFTGIVLIVLIIRFKSFLLRTDKMWSVMFWGVIDTLPHEISHWLVASITGGRPYGFSIIPKKRVSLDGQRYIWDFGSVSAYVAFYNAFLIGLAPLFLLIVAFFVFMNYFNYMPNTWWSILLFYFILYVLIENSIPSAQDIKVAFSQNSWLFYMIIGIVTFLGYKFFDNYTIGSM